MHSGTFGLEAESSRLARDELRAQYRAYRRRQARALVRMLPRDAIRPLYRRATQRAVSDDPYVDPLAKLVAYCETLLPLPPFDVWCADRTLHPEEHLRDLDDSAEAPTAEAPATVESRALDIAGRTWVAHLKSFRDGVTWRGFIAFEDSRSHVVHRTAVIFREWAPGDVRERFQSFDPAALAAFFRSALP